MIMPCLDDVGNHTPQQIFDKLHNDTVAAIIECLKIHHDADLVEGDLIIRLVTHDMIDFNLDGSVESVNYAVDVIVDEVEYIDETSFRLYYSESKYDRGDQCRYGVSGAAEEIDRIPNSSHSIVLRSNSGMTGTFVNPTDLLRLLGLIKYTVEVVLDTTEDCR